jgi:hypothetical protein
VGERDVQQHAWGLVLRTRKIADRISPPVRQSRPNRAVAWRNNDLSIRYICSVLGLFGPVVVDVWAWRSRVKAESYCACNLPCVLEPACIIIALHSIMPHAPMPVDGDEIMSIARQSTCAHVAHDIVHDTVQDTTHGGGPDATRCDLSNDP